MYSGSATVPLKIGGKLNGFGMRLKPSGSRGGTWSEFVKRVPIHWSDKLDKTLYISNYVSLLHVVKFDKFESSVRAHLYGENACIEVFIGKTKTYSLHIHITFNLRYDMVLLGMIRWWGLEWTRHLCFCDCEMFVSNCVFVERYLSGIKTERRPRLTQPCQASGAKDPSSCTVATSKLLNQAT